MGFPDPAAAGVTDEEKRGIFRKVRDQIRKMVEEFLREEASATI
jgi:hypothetical protein